MIDEIYALHGDKDQWQLRDWCHERCGEWIPLRKGRKCINIEELAVNVGRSQEEAARIAGEGREANLLSRASTGFARDADPVGDVDPVFHPHEVPAMLVLPSSFKNAVQSHIESRGSAPVRFGLKSADRLEH